MPHSPTTPNTNNTNSNDKPTASTPPTPPSNTPTPKNTWLNKLFPKKPINAYGVMFGVALFLTATANLGFFNKAMSIYPFAQNPLFISSMALVLLGAMFLFMVIFSYRYTLKAVAIFLIMVGSITGYFTDMYGTVYDTTMLQNALQTDSAETADLLGGLFFVRVFLLGVLPSLYLAKLPVYFPPFKRNILWRAGAWVLSFALVLVPVGAMSKQYASFFREHKPIRFYTNPLTPIYSVGKLASIEYKKFTTPKHTIMHATDATQTTKPDTRKPKLVVMILGETARGDHVNLNGYERNTFPKMAQTPNLVSFNNVISCGTSTAYSVPCMFSYLGMDNYDVDSAKYQENALDTLHRLGVGVLWRDNNSDSKGVMDKLPSELYANYKTAPTNTDCDNAHQECRDTGMLVGLDDYLKSQDKKDVLIILHQMGNHGPAYFKRYNPEFEQFTPICPSNDLAKCDRQAVINTYDNALLATDDFLAKTIDWLQTHSQDRQVAMFYISDHGESLGEKNVYLHGLPNAFAPKEQRDVPAMFWTPADSGYQAVAKDTSLTHDAITPTLLGLFDVQSQATKDKAVFAK